jgi:hypothetical protein
MLSERKEGRKEEGREIDVIGLHAQEQEHRRKTRGRGGDMRNSTH